MQRPNQPPWMLIPGHMCDHRMWSGVRPALIKNGIDVLDADLSLDDCIEDMARRALNCLDRPTVVVGFSMGGMVALRMQAAAPQMIAAMGLINTNARPDLPERAQMRLEQQNRVQHGMLSAVVRDELLPHYFFDAARLDPGQVALVQAMAAALGPEVFLRQSEAIRLRPDSRRDLGGVQCPTIVIGGLDDRLCLAEWQRDLAAGISSAAQELLPCVGHFAPLEAPTLVGEALLSWAREHRLGV